jgi:hypothetical protein
MARASITGFQRIVYRVRPVPVGSRLQGDKVQTLQRYLAPQVHGFPSQLAFRNLRIK